MDMYFFKSFIRNNSEFLQSSRVDVFDDANMRDAASVIMKQKLNATNIKSNTIPTIYNGKEIPLKYSIDMECMINNTRYTFDIKYKGFSMKNPLKDNALYVDRRSSISGFSSDIEICTREDVLGVLYIYPTINYAFFVYRDYLRNCFLTQNTKTIIVKEFVPIDLTGISEYIGDFHYIPGIAACTTVNDSDNYLLWKKLNSLKYSVTDYFTKQVLPAGTTNVEICYRNEEVYNNYIKRNLYRYNNKIFQSISKNY